MGKLQFLEGGMHPPAPAIATVADASACGPHRPAVVRSLAGQSREHLLQCLIYSGTLRRKAAFDGGERREPAGGIPPHSIQGGFLRSAQDLDLVRGPGGQCGDCYLEFHWQLQDWSPSATLPSAAATNDALRFAQLLLKSGYPRPRELAAYTESLLLVGHPPCAKCAPTSSGDWFRGRRKVSAPSAKAPNPSGSNMLPGSEEDGFSPPTSSARLSRCSSGLRLTTVGPRTATSSGCRWKTGQLASFSSEGQQRTTALALKLAQARIFGQQEDVAPLLPIDDMFLGSWINHTRRNALLQLLAA